METNTKTITQDIDADDLSRFLHEYPYETLDDLVENISAAYRIPAELFDWATMAMDRCVMAVEDQATGTWMVIAETPWEEETLDRQLGTFAYEVDVKR